MWTKQALRKLGQEVGLQYVCIEEPCYIFQERLTGEYKFLEYKFLEEDLTIPTLKLMKKLKMKR